MPDEADSILFFRITVLGGTGCGKTSLVNRWVNGLFPHRYVSTEKGNVFLKKTSLPDETEYKEMLRPVLVEVEDTPGSDKGGDPDAPSKPPGGQIVKGSRVEVIKDKKKLMELFKQHKKEEMGTVYKPGMDGLLGQELKVRSVDKKDGTVYLPSPDGSEGGVWGYPPGAVAISVALKLPIDQFLKIAEKERVVISDVQEKKKYAKALKLPLSAYARPIGSADVDKTLTRNRMAYLICFDMSNPELASLKEAMEVYKMLKKALEETWIRPLVWFVGCKSDLTIDPEAIKRNKAAAETFAEEEEFLFFQTSAHHNSGVRELFSELVQELSSRANLWTLHGDAAGADDDEQQESGCSLQ